MDDASAPGQRRSRFWLFAPFIILALAAAGWTVAWFTIRSEADRVLNAWLAREAALGRQWTCPNRALGGFPFRIELSCNSLALQRPDFRVTLGRVSAVAQVYRPRHIIAEVSGPLHATDGRITVAGTWQRLRASLRVAPESLQRASLVIGAPAFRVTGITADEFTFAGEHLETHLRPNPGRGASEGAYDWSLDIAQGRVPALDALIGDPEPADVDLQLTATQMRDVRARRWPEEVERWRQAGGRIEIARLRLLKGPRGLEAKGQIRLDEAHRPEGRIEAAASGLEKVLGQALGAPSGLAGALLGGASRPPAASPQASSPPQPQAAPPALSPLPPVRLDNGRLYVGPFPIPGIRLMPLY